MERSPAFPLTLYAYDWGTGMASPRQVGSFAALLEEIQGWSAGSQDEAQRLAEDLLGRKLLQVGPGKTLCAIPEL